MKIDKSAEHLPKRGKDKLLLLLLLLLLWSVFIVFILKHSFEHHHIFMKESALIQARSIYHQIKIFKSFVSSSGGIYLPISDKVQPNEYLTNIPERDIETHHGKLLTLMNHGYLTRKLAEFSAISNHHIKFKIVSVKPINPQNSPDEWESQAFQKVERLKDKPTDIFEFFLSDASLKFMGLLFIEESCLKCHSSDGYKVGDLKGAISIKMDISDFIAHKDTLSKKAIFLFSFLWVIGIFVIIFVGYKWLQKDKENRNLVLDLEKSLKELKDFAELFSSGRTVIFKWENNPIWSVKYVSSNVSNIFGYSKEDFEEGRVSYLDIIHPDDLFRVKSEVSQALTSSLERINHKPYRVVGKSGEIVWLLDSTLIQRDNEGNFEYFIGYVVDINQLKLFENRLNTICESANVALWEWDIKKERFTYGKYVFQLLGYQPHEITDDMLKWTHHIHPDDLDRRNQALKSYLDKESKDFHSEYRVKSKSGDWFWVASRGIFSEVDKDNTPTKISGAMWNINSIKLIQNERDRELSKFKTLLDNLNVGILVGNENREVSYINKYIYDFFGLPEGQIKYGDRCEKVLPVLVGFFEGSDDVYITLKNNLSKSVPVFNQKYLLKDGRVVLNDYIPVFLNDSLIATICIFKDISKIIELEKKLSSHERLAVVGQLSAGIAHDFNNILSIIIGRAELLSSRKEISDDIKSKLNSIIDAANRAANLVRQLLDFSQKSIRFSKKVNLYYVVKGHINFIRNIIPENVVLTFSSEDKDYIVEADTTQLDQVLSNLIINAVKALPKGGSIKVDISRIKDNDSYTCSICSSRIEGKWVVVKVVDNGCGIPDDVLPKIFDPFFTTRKVGEGSGLGLSQVFGIVNQHHGHIVVESQLDKGTSFSILLPLVAPEHEISNLYEDEDDIEISTIKKESAHQEKKRSILLVEDESDLVNVMSAFLENVGFSVTVAKDGVEALNKFEANNGNFDLVISDMVMPNMNGVDLLRYLKGKDYKFKFLMISGYPMEKDVAGLFDDIQTFWLQKPINFKKLSRLLDKILEV